MITIKNNDVSFSEFWGRFWLLGNKIQPDRRLNTTENNQKQWKLHRIFSFRDFIILHLRKSQKKARFGKIGFRIPEKWQSRTFSCLVLAPK